MIELLECKNDDEWNQFLDKEKGNQMITIAHNPSLGPILSKTYGYSCKNMLIKADNETVGVLPFVTVGNKEVSMPHFSYGGPVFGSDKKIDLDLQSIFVNKKFEIRGFTKLSPYFNDEKICCILKLPNSADEQLKNIKSRLRNKIKNTVKSGFDIKIGGEELLDDFYFIYIRRMLQLGSPPFGKIFFQNILDGYKFGDVEIAVAYHDDKIVAAGFSLSYLGFKEVCWAASDTGYNKHNTNTFLHWEMVKSSIAKGYVYFSFGRSTIDSTHHKYKKNWNSMEFQIYFNYSEERTKSIKNYRFLTKIWKHQPLKTSIYFGHLISKYIY